ncbi:MAG: hypothetical protein LBM62_01625, partial [Mediterranea sp.]|nr:hypothetical protein [Mediterranea sp.]
MTLHPYMLLISTLFVSTACTEQHQPKNETTRRLPTELFRSGDIAFRRGTGLASRAVLYAGENGVYSHTGILNRHADGSWWIIHAVPGEPV